MTTPRDPLLEGPRGWANRRSLALAIGVWAAWLIAVSIGDRWSTVADNLGMAVTMLFGSLIAGATSEGGGAVAFPVLTLAFGAAPSVARDFALMIQSVGMTAAAAAIFWGRIKIAKRPLAAAFLGGVPGVLVGISLVSPLLPAAPTKLAFVALWASFGVALGWSLHSRPDRPERATIALSWSRGGQVVLVLCGFLGGLVSGVCGSGIDVVTFSALTLAFGVDERIATPTSVVLMGGNAVVGFLWRLGAAGPPISPEAWGYWWAAVPVVVVGAPLGAKLIASRSRSFIVHLLQFSIVAQLLGALLLIPLDPLRMGVLVGTFVGGLTLFLTLSRLGAAKVRRRASRWIRSAQCS